MTILKEHTILYVEDEPNIQKNMKEYLDGYFKRVYTASDGLEGLQLYETYRPDVLMLDIDLPKMDGLSLARAIREHDKSVSIIMLTAFTDKEKLLKATELKLVKYMVKPLDLLEFRETLRRLVDELGLAKRDLLHLGSTYFWDHQHQQLFEKEQEVALTSKEQNTLALLIKHRSCSVSFEEIIATVWADEYSRDVSYNCVKNVITSLRKKLPKERIKNVYGQGYSLQ